MSLHGPQVAAGASSRCLSHGVSPVEGLSTFFRAWLKDFRSSTLGLMDVLGYKSSDHQRHLVCG